MSKIRFGTCERCGHRGSDDTTGDAESGYELKYFQGQWLGPVCFAEAHDALIDSIRRDDYLEEERFRNSVGITG